MALSFLLSRRPLRGHMMLFPFPHSTFHPSLLLTSSKFRSSNSYRHPGSHNLYSSLSKPKYENIYTLPNFLTLSRIASCPLISWAILSDRPMLATFTLLYAGLSDLADGTLARKYPSMSSVLGTILDPAADKILMTTMVLSLSCKGLLPVPLGIIIIGRDLLLSLSALYFRYMSLPKPKTFQRFWDVSLPSAEVKPTQISKYNTFLQLVLVGITTVSPLVPYDIGIPLIFLQVTVGATTIGSGLSYVFSKNSIKYLK